MVVVQAVIKALIPTEPRSSREVTQDVSSVNETHLAGAPPHLFPNRQISPRD